MNPPTVTDNPVAERFEAHSDGRLAGFAEYRLTDALIVFTHTEVDPAFEGQGVGGTLVRGALDHVRDLGLRVLPICPFVQGWMAKHRDYADLDYRRPASNVID